MLAPVAVFTYNRHDEVVKVMNALSSNLLAKKTEVYVFSNAPIRGKEGDDEIVSTIRNDLRKYKKAFLKYHLVLREENNGSNANMLSGIDEVVQRHGKVIVLEDDILVAKSFLNFMNQALDKYEIDKEIFSICGYNPVTRQIKLDGDSFSYDAFRSWGWGIWKDRWDSFINEDDDTISRVSLQKTHSEGLMYISTLRYDLIHRSHNDVRFLDYMLACRQMADKKTVIYSKRSMCDNIGLIDNSETSSQYSEYNNENFNSDFDGTYFELSKERLNIQSDPDYFFDFRWNEFAMDMYFDRQYNRDGLYHSMYYALSLLQTKGVGIQYYFKKRGIERIGIYGWGEAGQLLYELCRNADIEVCFAMDSRRINENRLKIFDKIDDIPVVDMIVVSAIRDFSFIEKKIYGKVTCPIACMDDLIAECKVHLIDEKGM